MHGASASFRALNFERKPAPEMVRRASDLLADVSKRRSVRSFGPDPIPAGILDDCIELAGTAPSGAHKQPWTFVVVTDPAHKKAIREAAEEEERENYGRRMNEVWLKDLAPFGTNHEKPFLEIAPALIVAFRHAWQEDENGERQQCYYTQESIGVACGFLLLALHHAGLATLTHTPSPMGFLSQLLQRPKNEKPFLLIPVGYPTVECEVPDIERKPLDEIRVHPKVQ